VNVFYVSVRTTENYEFDKIRTAGVTENATNYKNIQGDNDNPICSTRDKISQPSRPISPRAATAEEHDWVRQRCRLCVWKWLQAVALPAQNCLRGPNTTGVFRKAARSLVRPWALILDGRIYGANIWVEYWYYFLSRYTVCPTLYWVWILFAVDTLHQWSANFFITAQITFPIAIEGPPHFKPLEQKESDTGNMQLPYNSPGGYLVHVLFSQFVYFPINGPGQPSGKPHYDLKRATVFYLDIACQSTKWQDMFEI